MISLKSKITTQLLNYFFLHEEDSAYISELAKILRADTKNVYRKLEELQREGLLQSEFRGKEKFFSLNKQYPLLEPYRQIFFKTAGLEQQLQQIIRMCRGVQEAYIFGSYARDQMDAASDIDLMVIGDHSVIELQKKIYQLAKATGREINVVSLSPREFEGKKRKKDQFITNVLEGKIIKLT